MTIDKKEYQVISSYKFILCILVVFLHNKTLDYFQLTGNQTKIYNFFVYYIPQLAVPSFMLLSGFLMFHGYDSKTVKGKIKRRMSKLIPAYLFWNVIAIPYTVVVIGYNRSFSSVQDILGGYDILTYKFNFPLWYIFDLIIFIALSSALYVILRDRRLGLIAILIIYILYSVGVGLPDIMYRDDTHLYYLLGAYAGLHCQVEQIKKLNSRKMFVIGVLGLLLSMICWDFGIKVVALSIYAVGMTVGYCNLVQKTPFSHETSEIFAANTFVYYSHFFFIGGIKKLIGIIFGKLSLDGILWCSIAFCLSTLACIIVILYLRKVLHAIINKVGNDRLKKMAVILIP